MSWPVRQTRVAYENPWIVVHEDVVTRPDGTEGLYGVVEVRRPAVFVVALTDDDEVVLVTVDRHTVGSSIEVPAGGTDGQDPLVAAQRELAEETGLAASEWRRIGGMDALNGICRAPEHVFLATGLSPAPGIKGRDVQDREEEGISHVRRVPLTEVVALVRDGAITDSETLAALLHALVALGRVG
ncbi:NUDIX hydrolase [Intrasporangium oryzae NRRL B-24470]|uniref:NUDIX hydrolase n=1 Tax=Intrasporangium oryzae NRRL B-24470 TaxID=1386089 RepID=W9GFF7_9MICO|nr:NUDIX hydrolase [Intrasporangium oryzae]EWT02594.1 NUDIX hydrolase [Intrasporangium oryzae NRRL B-24470]